MFAMFWIFGVEINQNGVVNFQDAIMYFKILGFTIIFFICITVLYIFLEKMEEKSENKLSEESSKINLKKYIIIAIIFLICWTPVFLQYFQDIFAMMHIINIIKLQPTILQLSIQYYILYYLEELYIVYIY